jgi:hypothetical protein
MSREIYAADGGDLTEEEQAAIRSLERLAKRWPRTLGLFDFSGSLSVVRGNGRGGFLYEDDGRGEAPSRIVDIFGIPSGGGGPGSSL